MSGIDLSQSFDWLKKMNSLPSLLGLHLRWCSLPAVFNHPTVNSSSLVVLDLAFNYPGGPIPNVLQNMTSPFLRELHLSNNDFNSSIPNWLYDFTHLQLLDLRYNVLQGQISSAGIGNLTSLITLDMSRNYELEFEKGIPNSFRNFCSLRSLDLSYMKLNQEMNDILEILSSGCVSDGLQSLRLGPLSGYLSDGIGQNFKNLRHLFLYGTDHVHGTVPESFKYLCNLRILYLSGFKLNQEINDVLAIMSSGSCVNSNVLQELMLYDCQLSGHLTYDLRYFKNLSIFHVPGNSISGPIPLSFGELDFLESVDLSNNKLEGSVSPLHFANLTRLVGFFASDNKNITLRVSSNWIPPLQLHALGLGSWHIGSQFPKWLRLLKNLIFLDLSNSGISTPVPIWFWENFSNNNYYYLNFSHNQMHGSISDIPFVTGGIPVFFMVYARVIVPVFDLSSNNFSGALPYFSSDVTTLDLSNNSFSGSIFNFLCNNTNEEKQMAVLNLERNALHGEIPDCWSSWKNLVALKLGNNKFSGNIPNSIGTLSSLQSLHLHNNNLSGQIPSQIQNCKKLFTLDLSENNLVGNIPTWIRDGFTDLIILSLHGNKFDGYLPKELCHLVSLHILHLAHNSFSGPIPRCFSNFMGMVTRNDSIGSIYGYGNGVSYTESTSLMMKGNVMEYSTILRLVRSMDLSDNNLSGEIPTEITSLEGLVSLNLSQNALTGGIPDSIGEMRWLEVMDFSQNQLVGHIPESMSTLNSLSRLNLSYNNLSGKIPSGTQLQSFDLSSFAGNQLCGLPLIKSCNLDDAPPVIDNGGKQESNGVEVDFGFYLSMMLGFVFGFWNVVGSLIFIKRWRYFYFRSLNNLWNCFGKFR